jgi:glycosyltransferase involved in cell wall biosynthesis
VVVIDHTAQLGGGELAMARLVAAVDPERFDVRVLLLSDGPLCEVLRRDGTPFAVIPASETLTGAARDAVTSSLAATVANAMRTLALVPAMVRAIKGADADLVVANTLKSAVLTAIAAPLAGRRWVWHLHDRLADDYLPARLAQAMRVLARFGPRTIVANSIATRSTMPSVPDVTVSVAYPGVDPGPERHAVSGAADAAPTFGLLGRIAPTKGQLEFLRAAAAVASDHAETRFTVIGDALFNDAEFASEVHALADSLGLGDRVTFTGWVDDPATAVRELTALVHASPVPEPFGQVLVEAMLAGTAVIGTDAGGVPEILLADDGAEIVAPGVRRTAIGLLVSPGDVDALRRAMTWMLEHPAERAGMIENGVRSARERFDIRRSARIVEASWARALGRSPGSAPDAAADMLGRQPADEDLETP